MEKIVATVSTQVIVCSGKIITGKESSTLHCTESHSAWSVRLRALLVTMKSRNQDCFYVGTSLLSTGFLRVCSQSSSVFLSLMQTLPSSFFHGKAFYFFHFGKVHQQHICCTSAVCLLYVCCTSAVCVCACAALLLCPRFVCCVFAGCALHIFSVTAIRTLCFCCASSVYLLHTCFMIAVCFLHTRCMYASSLLRVFYVSPVHLLQSC